jgi:hypothetical protein
MLNICYIKSIRMFVMNSLRYNFVATIILQLVFVHAFTETLIFPLLPNNGRRLPSLSSQLSEPYQYFRYEGCFRKYKRTYAKNQYSTILYSSYVKSDDTEPPFYGNKDDYNVWYAFLVNDQKYQETQLGVKPGLSINSITSDIVAQNRPLLAYKNFIKIELFQSMRKKKPLCPSIEWDPTVPWGTARKPLIVKITPASIVQSLSTPITNSKVAVVQHMI